MPAQITSSVARRILSDIIAQYPEAAGAEHWSTAMSDDGLGVFTFGTDRDVFKWHSDGAITVRALDPC